MELEQWKAMIQTLSDEGAIEDIVHMT